jgi:hypothetical protein
MRVVMGPPVCDIREAMRPAESAGAVLDAFAHKLIDIGESGRAAVQGVVNEIAAKVMPGHDPPTVAWTKLDDGRTGLPIGFFDDPPFVYEFTDANGPMRCHPASGVGPLTLHVQRPHVATLPDGTRVNLPAGTVLREGTADVLTPLQVLCNIGETLTALGYGLAPVLDTVKAIVAQNKAARDLLQRARVRLVDEPDAKKLDAEIAAFLAGASPPEHPLFALVRSFVGKPGDKPGPAWTALMCVQARLDDDDLDGAKAAATALEEALNERLGQMHDAIGRDTTEERTL